MSSRRIAGDNNDAQAGIDVSKVREHGVAFDVAHFHIQQDDVGQALLASGEQFIGVREGPDGVKAVVLERVFQVIAEDRDRRRESRDRPNRWC